MRGSIKYLMKIRQICSDSRGNCKRCPLGNKRKLEDNICPRLTDPRTWSDDFINAMVRIDSVKKEKTLLDSVAEWDEAVEKYGYVN